MVRVRHLPCLPPGLSDVVPWSRVPPIFRLDYQVRCVWSVRAWRVLLLDSAMQIGIGEALPA